MHAFPRVLLACCFWIVCVGLLAAPVVGADDPEQPTPADAKEDATKELPKEVPDATPAELFEFIEQAQEQGLSGETRAERLQSAVDLLNVIVTAADKILAHDDLEQGQTLEALNAKVGALTQLARIGDPAGTKLALATARRLKGDENPQIAAIGKFVTLQLHLFNLESLTKAESNEVVDGLIFMIESQGLDGQSLNLCQTIARVFESRNFGKPAERLYRFLAGLCLSSDNENVVELGRTLEASARRVGLLGKPIELEGQTLSGQPLDWNSYRGKVVLVDFWATWCGPCLAELPNVISNYEKYHDRGFDVVGISLDYETEQVTDFIDERQIAWTQIFSPDENQRGYDHPLAVKYGVNAIPTSLLVDQQGKVVLLSVRGEQLGETLEKLLGSAGGGGE